MRYKGRRQSSNVEDRRGLSGRQIGFRGGIGTIVIVVIILLLGGDPQSLLNLFDTGQGFTESATPYEPSAHEQELAEFVKVVLADTEDVWHLLFDEMGQTYREPKLVLFSEQVQSACGFSGAATGPFYCPGDERVYIDLQFLEQLQDRLGAQGDFAVAYIIAHEVGHHVQKLTGTLDQVHGLRGKLNETAYNKLTVQLELQADFYAGIWAHHAQKMKNILEEGDLEEAFRAAQAVGDDRIQLQSQGYVVPDSFTHGTSAQRMSWFKRGFSTGDITQGDTFNSAN
ncbi:KPN_02809 family neutral zinc metallopeptidase [Gaoshiqia sediminis]|uniref:Neutral zinc metallopeptidase n=1 Tax=Gaoshiqia sediminis TaxID=2986998 RepID=A0AA42C9T0_9BACT|nr:neutral zinc metallopeptidase [Gaoshiqia sediminis]MCW0484426.1 neutral zinc metallopeptidase [Gaoshiqia sediminis]